ncbi:MAG: invasion associated locus B family protein [Albidovulum sp.]
MAGPGLAQEAAAPATTEEAAPAATETTSNPDGIGEPYVSESHGDWQLRCIRTADGSDPCQLYQLLKDKGTGDPISEISLVALPDGGDAAAGATIITPLETLLTQQMNISVDGGPTKRFPFTFCAEIGCVARVGFTKEDLAGFRKGKIAVISVVPVADPTRTVDVDISLAGFTAGFEAVAKANAPKE